MRTEYVKLLDEVTSTTTSKDMYVGDCTKLLFIVTRADDDTGASAFTFNGGMSSNKSTTAPTMVALNVIKTNVANANTETVLLTTGKTITNEDASYLLWLDLEEFPLEFINCTVTETSNGTHSCSMIKFID